jgi:hypothetical protein
VLAAIILLGALPRLANLQSTGIFGVDDGRYILDGLSKKVELENGANLLHGKWSEIIGGRDFRLAEFVPLAADRLSLQHPFSPKLGFSYLTGAVLTWSGAWVSAASYIDAVAGILLIGVLILYVRGIRDWPTGLIAGAMLAVSGYSVYYARNPYPQSTASLLLLLAIWAHARATFPGTESQWRFSAMSLLFLCGVFSGFSFWVHYQVAGALPALVVVHGLICYGNHGARQGTKQFISGGALIAAGFFAVMVFAEVITYPWILLFRSQQMTYPHATFLELLWPRLVSQTSVPPNPSGLLLFPFFHGVLEGFPATLVAAALLAGAGFLAIRERSHGDRVVRFRTLVYLVTPFVVPVRIFSLKTMQGARTFTFALPFFAGMLAVAVVALWRRPSPYRPVVRVVVVMLLCVSAASSLARLREILAIRSAYPQFITYLKQEEMPGACAAWSSVLESYLIQEGMEGGSLYRYVGEGRTPPPMYVSDWQELYDRRYPDEAIALPPNAAPILEFSQSFGRIFLDVEAFPSYGNTLDNIRFVRGLELDRARKLLIFDLRDTGMRTHPSPSTPAAPREQR